MIREDYCSFELSKLLKEKGFDIPCKYAWHGGIKKPDFHRHSRNFNGGEYKDLRTKWYSAPTHQMAMKWLREECKVFIGVKYNPYYKKFKVHITLMDYSKEAIIKGAETEINNFDNIFFDTYEEAVEAALKYSLENLI